MLKHILVVTLFIAVFIPLMPADNDKTSPTTKWNFEADKFAQKICKNNQWQFKSEYTTPLTQKYLHHFRLFEAIKPIDKSYGNLLILIISSQQKDYILHKTLTFEEIEIQETLYPKNKKEALEMATLKEELSKDYNLWIPYYSLKSQVVKEDKDNLAWEIIFTYHRPTLRALSGPVYKENETPPLTLVPEKDSVPLPDTRYLTRIVKLTHPLKFEIEKLIILLGNDDWVMREKATDKLITIGKPVASLLQEVINNVDPEIRMRANFIMGKIGLKKDE